MVPPGSCPNCGTPLREATSVDGLCLACLFTGALDKNHSPAAPGAGTFDLEPGTMHGPFRIVGVLGKGGMATVYEAYEAPLERVVALKVLPPAFLHDETFANRFTQEARLAASLEHPNIVPIYAGGIDAGIPWMSMRLLDGGSLSDLIGPEGLGIEQTTRVLHSVAEALDYAHASGVVHRDLKPSNILLDRSNRVYIADFGLAVLMEGRDRLTRSGTILGTPHYMAPEQGLGTSVDYRCDLYSLGVIAYEMLTGTTPFRGSSPVALLMQHATDPVPVPPRALVSDAQFAVLRKALAKKAEQRWQSGVEFVAALESSTSRRHERTDRCGLQVGVGVRGNVTCVCAPLARAHAADD